MPPHTPHHGKGADAKRAEPQTFKLLRFRLGAHDFATDASHLAHVRPASSLASSTPVHELAADLGIHAAPSSQIATFATPPVAYANELPLWLGLGQHAEIISCEAHNILVFPPWLGGHLSRLLLPACLHSSTLDPSAPRHLEQASSITWLLDMFAIREHVYKTSFAANFWWQRNL